MSWSRSRAVVLGYFQTVLSKLSSATELRMTHPIFVPSRNRGVPHISLVFREMWDTTNLNLFPAFGKTHVERCGIPHLAKNERDMGHPTIPGRDKVERQSRAAHSFVPSNQMGAAQRSLLPANDPGPLRFQPPGYPSAALIFSLNAGSPKFVLRNSADVGNSTRRSCAVQVRTLPARIR
jgi:hypothetical protein